MITSLSRYIKTLTLGTLAGVAMTSCTEEIDAPAINNPYSENFGIDFRCTEMVETFHGSHNPASRASDTKQNEEKEIKSVHIFFFDPKTGDLLEPADYDNFTSYIYREKGDAVNPAFLSIPFKAGSDGKTNEMILFNKQPEDGNVRVVAIANIDAVDNGVNRFRTIYDRNPSGDIREEGRSDTKFNSDEENPYLVISNYEDLKKWIYYPPIRMSEDGVSGDISSLPESGMPMITPDEKEFIINIKERSNETPQIQMKALMAKVNVSIELDPDQSTSQFPLLTITEYGVRNMPIAVPFVMPNGERKNGVVKPTPGNFSYKDYIDMYNVTSVPVYHRTEVSDLPSDPFHTECVDAAHEFTTKVNVTLDKDSKPYTFSYYTFENINLPNFDAKLADGTPAFDDDLQPIYPKNAKGEVIVKDEDKQRWKSTFAYSDRASALILKGRYTTHQGISYNAEFSIYMGADPDIDFQVQRNHQYDNNIVIHGLDYIRNSVDNVYNFDGRVNVYDTDNPLYLAIVNERKVDAHATALPMDVWLMLRENGTYNEPTPYADHYTEVKFTIPTNAQDWMQMVLIPRAEMEAKDDNGEIFTAGRGAEKYFYTELLNDIKNRPEVVLKGGQGDAYRGHYEGAQCGSEVTVYSTPGANGGELNNSRSRIYFYIDENLTEDNRTASILVDYKSYKLDENGNQTDVRTLSRTVDIEQKGLLKVDGTWTGNGGENATIPETYMEYFEEYLEHNDPLDRHEQPGEYYTGLPWGLSGLNVYGFGSSNPDAGGLQSARYYKVYYKTGAISMYQWLQNQNGFGAIRDVNLFNENAPQSAFHYCYGKNKRDYNGDPVISNNGCWYLPGIRELERSLVQHYTTFKEFHGNLYWSSSAAQETNGTFGYGQPGNYARATSVTINGNTTSYANSGNSNDAGYNLRTKANRIRAFYRKN